MAKGASRAQALPAESSRSSHFLVPSACAGSGLEAAFPSDDGLRPGPSDFMSRCIQQPQLTRFQALRLLCRGPVFPQNCFSEGCKPPLPRAGLALWFSHGDLPQAPSHTLSLSQD